jgi:hypothetical protein
MARRYRDVCLWVAALICVPLLALFPPQSLNRWPATGSHSQASTCAAWPPLTVLAADYGNTAGSNGSMEAATALDRVAQRQLGLLALQGAKRAGRVSGSLPLRPTASIREAALGLGDVGIIFKVSQRAHLQVTHSAALSWWALAPVRDSSLQDRQASVSEDKWVSMHSVLHGTLDPWLAEELEPYL